MNAIANPIRFGMVSYHPAIPTAGTTDPSRVEGEGGRGGQEQGDKSRKTNLKIQSTR